ncbi:MAG: sulfotransferase [Actinomycetota bacterium]
MTIRPLFLLSLPRSGSTLVQRVLAAHPDIATAAEPWVLLPHTYATRATGVYAEYGHALAARAINEFVAALPGGEETYRDELRAFTLRLYEHAAGGAGVYFLDKTPRYHFIADELFDLFPDGKFVFLWRNPLSVVASTVETWGRGKWKIGRWRIDLFDGLANLVASHERHAGTSLSMRYEDLVSDPHTYWPVLFDHLEIPFDPAILTSFPAVRVPGRFGDPTGVDAYDALTTRSVDKWRATLANPFRKRWSRNYLGWIGAERLAMMGYDLDELMAELDAVRGGTQRLGSDLVRSSAAWVVRAGRERGGRLLWESARGGDARSSYESPTSEGQGSSP